ncbi:putative ankyrin repeat protein RF_0381 [Leptopilina boulardi]|uniref:putative ankyrin repeat protein RF_0381 n=1 Tax=Leptopilina boulardi TaxID=63433 RepID=UPI0021F68813|nr:putative ankyrin repeat protein RF_0381 [Leptopilina boulardi]
MSYTTTAKKGSLSQSDVNKLKNALKKNDIVGINEIISEKRILHAAHNGNTLLHFVAESGTLEIANRLLKFGANVHAKNKYGQIPILYALRNSFEMVKLLFNEKTHIDKNLLRNALYYGTEEIVRLLLQNAIVEKNSVNSLEDTENLIKFILYDKNLSLRNEYNYPLLIFFAAKIGNKNILQFILNDCREYLAKVEKRTKDKKNLELLNIENDKGETALHYAVSQQHLEAINFLLIEGIDVNCKNITKWTPLHYAVCLENENICKLLLNFGANVNTNDDGENNPLHLVCGYRLGKIFRGFDDLSINIFRQYTRRILFNSIIIELLLKHGADANREGNNGKKILFHVCEAERSEEMLILLKFGANIHVEDSSGNKILHYAVVYTQSIEIVDFLLNNGLDIDVKNNQGNTPLMFLIQKEIIDVDLSMIEFLIERGTSLSVENNYDYTVFGMALLHRNEDVILMLLQLEGDIFLKQDWNDENEHITGTHCLGWYNYQKCPIFDKSVMALMTYLALTRNNINNYFPCCLNPNNSEMIFHWFDGFKSDLERLKSMKILKEDNDIIYTYYDFLTQDFLTAIRIIENEKMKQELLDFKFNQYSYFGNFIYHRSRWAVKLKNSYDIIVNFFLNYRKMNLPIVVIKIILSYISYQDFKTFGKILSHSNYEQKKLFVTS